MREGGKHVDGLFGWRFGLIVQYLADLNVCPPSVRHFENVCVIVIFGRVHVPCFVGVVDVCHGR